MGGKTCPTLNYNFEQLQTIRKTKWKPNCDINDIDRCVQSSINYIQSLFETIIIQPKQNSGLKYNVTLHVMNTCDIQSNQTMNALNSIYDIIGRSNVP